MTTARLRLAFVISAGVIAGGIAWWWLRPQPGFLLGMHPIDGERAAFTMRHNADMPREWIGVVDVSRGVVWSRELPGTSYSIYARHGLTVSAEQVTVKVSDAEHARILAFDLATGDERWQSARIAFRPSEPNMSAPFVTGERVLDDGTQLLHGDHDHASARLVARRASDGTISWSHDVSGRLLRQVLVTPEVLAYRDGKRWVFLDRENGAVVRELDAHGAGCVDDGRFVVWTNDDRLLTFDSTAKGVPMDEQSLPSVGIAQTCGTHGDHFVFTVMRATTSTAGSGFEIVGVARRQAAIDWRLDLGTGQPGTIARERDNDEPDFDPLSGGIADHVPFLMTEDDSPGTRLVVVDLARHAVAWQSPLHDELLHYQVFRGSGQQHFLSGMGRIVAIDGETGELTAAVELEHRPSRGFHASNGRLWVYSMAYRDMSSLPWIVLDGRTLETMGQGDPELGPVDVTDSMRRWLEAP